MLIMLYIAHVMHTNAHRCPQNYWYLCFYTVFQGFIFTIDIHVNKLS